MRNLFLLVLVLAFLTPSAFAFKSFYYNSKGERVYIEITPEITRRNKNRPRRSYIRQPRKTWEITDAMRIARRKTTSDFTHRH